MDVADGAAPDAVCGGDGTGPLRRRRMRARADADRHPGDLVGRTSRPRVGSVVVRGPPGLAVRVVLVAYGAAFAPWFANIDRQMYFFYATLMAPFLIIGLALCLGDVLRYGATIPRRANDSPSDRQILIVGLVALYLAVVILNFAWLWPVLTGVPITKLHWHQEIWLPSWS